MTEHTNTPELRFPEFKEEWEFQELGNLAQFSKGKLLSKKDLNISGIPCILYGELYTRYGAILNKVYSKTDSKKNSLVFSKKNQILIPSSGETDIDIATATAINTDLKIAIGGDLNIITPINSDGRFISLYINGKGKHNLAKYAQGKSVVHLYNSDIKKLKFYLPSNNSEQQKIGDFFSKLDRQIELEEEKLELLEQQKRGYMQKIFSQELRFKDDNGNSYPDWSIKKIEDISKVNKGFTPNTKNDEYWDELNENWLSIAGMTQKYLYKGNKGITEKGASKHVKVDKDTLIMSFKLTLGKLAIVKEPIYTNEAICHFVWKESNVNTEYMYYYLNSINISTFGAQAVKGVTLNNDSINSIIVKLPVIQEQNKIAYFFNELDKLIRKQYAKIEVLKQRKKGLLQKMFI
ncbi:TPA: restriction endonuclease subunit S [Staphylococcus pseudintermedius]|uniref:restriction endonuclease subunit S n=1 Tax=Staphylococcus pseudintermedius TaxID=283734 RepID=UPI0019F1501F|nr:restriction endonuclease subunit S [Staphylococcus pseudintermedius]EGQ1637990.1 restriction endonuclease subunit S [Staphylococcus pseudintermedius]EGQ4093537.1 restriction endonuclease subunit S [Staphylococcus pseudintermedius]EHS7161530.1 restriction endonuclease subunit S [Staphylococcus pseudintermedius]EJA1921538.1 restriction endonuclease subunit S [Staphylococcus pseudintermedius]EJA1951695.1 restriction endonuclease subunit S [Staphylococcus pseudintermedius]